MLKVKGYQVLDELHSSSNSTIYRAVREDNHEKVILKLLKGDFPSPQDIVKYKQEFQITNTVDLAGVIKSFDLIRYQENYIISFEDFDAVSLNELYKNKPPDLKTFLKISVNISEILWALHRKNIIHKDINPSNIVINPDTGKLKIIDFGISTELAQENLFSVYQNSAEGTIFYISPEQTGRMNRSLDYRTDFYSLGLTFYELLTGKKLFDSPDPLELIHFHIAREPVIPEEFKNLIPGRVAGIILKLISKNAEDRYQSAWGIKSDLEKCLESLRNNQDIKYFDLAENDIPYKFCISQKLFGREREKTILFELFDKVKKGNSELVMVAGYSGIGKTSLIQEIFKSTRKITEEKGLETFPFFCKGKFEQFKRHIPYSAVSQACSAIVRQILSESESILEKWKEKLTKSLGHNARIIVELVPELENIIGKQPEIKELNSIEAQNRINLTFANFIRVFASEERPVVFFLDDLQWSDSASLNLIQNILQAEDLTYFLFLGSYRDNEIDEKHSLMLALNNIKKYKEINTISLEPLNETNINELIAETLISNPSKTFSLSRLIYQKTKGNPFFVNELLKSIYEQKILAFNYSSYQWEWDQEILEKLEVSENVVNLVLQKLQDCPEEAKEFLGISACIGNHFSLKTLISLIDKPVNKIVGALLEVIETGAVIPLENVYRELLFVSQETLNSRLLNSEYKFQHDKVQQASYLLNESKDLDIIHLTIGRLMLARLSESEKETKIIEIVEQLNKGKLLVEKYQEKLELAALNLRAGKKAKLSAAYRPAMEYFSTGISILPEINWENNYQLTFDLFKSLAECAYICGEFDIAEEKANILINNAGTNLEKAEIYYIKSIQYTTMQKLEAAIESGRKGLSLLGINLPYDADPGLVMQEAGLISENLGQRKISDLINEPEISEPENIMMAKLLHGVFLPNYSLGNKNLLAYCIMKAVNLCLKYGNVQETPYMFNVYAFILGHVFNDMKTAYEFGKLGFALIEKFDDPRSKAINLFTNVSFVQYWNRPPAEFTEGYKQVIEAGLETGDLIFTSYACTNVLPWDNSIDLPKATEEGEKYLKIIKSSRFQDSIDVGYIFQNLRLNLTGKTKELFSLSNEFFDEEETLSRLKQTKNYLVTALYHIYKIQPCFHYENYELALHHILEAEIYAEALAGQAHMVDLTLFSFLTFSALYPSMSENEQNETMQRLENYLKKMSLWADNMPANFEHLRLLMEAELARLRADILKADDLYKKSTYLANNHSFKHHEAIANEMAARLWLGINKADFAKIYLVKARYAYEIWGATRKVKQLDEKYELLELNKPVKFKTYATTSSKIGMLDIETIIKSTQTLLSEKNLAFLIEKMIKLIIENGGAEKGKLILPKRDRWFIEAEYNVNSGFLQVLHSLPVSEDSLPNSILFYTIRTGETSVFNNILEEEKYTADPYIMKVKPLSVLCMPLVNKGNVQGILYLENNLATDAFTEKHLDILGLLSVQAAISLENAILYEELEQRVKERTSDLLKANEDLKLLNHEKNELLNIVTHNLKSPLGSVVGFASTMNKFKDLSKNEIELYTSQILSGGKRMLGMISDLLDINAIEEGNYKLKPASFDIVPLIEDLMLNYRDQLITKKIKMEIEKTADSIYLDADEAWLAQIIDNLISNAIKFSPPEKNILIKAEQSIDKTSVKIIDQGPGLNENDQLRLFQKFARLSALPTGGESSSCLGLSIVKKMVEIMGGRVFCESRAGQGATFILEF
jgi:predicted ATPase/signal transduction histidine kinase